MRAAGALLIALAAAWAPAPAAALYGAGSPVVELTPSNFESKIRQGGVWLVEFYAPW
jgi:protein disulfide-isomerase A6